MLQDTFKAMDFTPAILNLGLVVLFHSSIGAANDDPVARHDRHHNSDAATRNMDFLPATASQFSNFPQSYEKPTLLAGMYSRQAALSMGYLYIALLKIYDILFLKRWR